MVNALLLRPLPFRDPGRLVWITNGDLGRHPDRTLFGPSGIEPIVLRSGGLVRVLPRGRQQTHRNRRARASHERSGDRELLPVAGRATAIGRSFTTQECEGEFSAPPAALLSHSFWRWRFASDPGVVGRKLLLNNRPVQVVGVLPASFDFASVFAPGTPVDVFVPWPLKDKTKPSGNTMKVSADSSPARTCRARRLS